MHRITLWQQGEWAKVCRSSDRLSDFHPRARGWCWGVKTVKGVGGAEALTGNLNIPTADRDCVPQLSSCFRTIGVSIQGICC